ncbi:MAG: YebC/PmpR family DNA-binding transcriptional regulator [Candidatus Nomurabacteria bacterium]|jgi:YebC/PmpR family DNA-binding regulatory protein|nr:YebC/PmpR family DNA-binding transcriptional regulator [Candidatus Nomurabacteria bacterium]
MSGHSKWSTIKRAKGANDAKRGALFTKLGNQIAIAARGGADPKMNAALALAIEKARAANMPNANVERSIARAAAGSATALEEVVYEAYGQGGTAIIIETATDNRNRTFPDVRSTLNKNGGNIAESGSVMFNFDRKGVIQVAAVGEDALLAILEAGAEDAVEEDGEMVVYTGAKELAAVREKIIAAGLTVKDFGLEYVPKNQVAISDEATAGKLLKLLDALDELDDVVGVHTNADLG